MAIENNIIYGYINERVLSFDQPERPVVAGNVGVDYINIELDDEFSSAVGSVNVVFYRAGDNGDSAIKVPHEESIEIPWEKIREAGPVFVSVGVEATDGDVLTTAGTASFNVLACGMSAGIEPSAHTETILSRLESAADAAEEIIESEIARAAAETARASAESARSDAETARVAAETARVTAEEGRAEAETERVSSEEARSATDAERSSAESARAAAELSRVSAEDARVSAETARVAAETARVTAEGARATAESTRVSNETDRMRDEDTRDTNENARKAAETARAASWNEMSSDIEAKTVAANTAAANATSIYNTVKNAYDNNQFKGDKGDPLHYSDMTESDKQDLANRVGAEIAGLEFHFCSSMEYDHETLLPIVQGRENVFYFVPDDAAETGNLFIEYLWADNAWERVGSSKQNLAGYATEQWVEDKGYLTQHQSLSAYRTATEQDAIHDSTKQDLISDLGAIRSGAALGATAIQEHQSLEGYLKNGDISDWAKAATKPTYTYSEVGAAASSHTHSQYQPTLTAGTNITIENNVISASGGGTGAYNFTVGEDGHLYVQTTDETTNYYIGDDGHLYATV